ncbi:MAG: hypothetical protein IVW52_18970 [Acidimicrobiales bacterium]|nr:hypothetical protein [Acidimicrobiales bacterium]
MFVQDFKIIDRPYDEVEAMLRTSIGEHLGAALDSTRAEGERLQLKVCPAGWPAPLAKTVGLHPGPLRAQGDGELLAFSREAQGGASLFPRLDADLEVSPFGTDQTTLALRGRYEPPAGTLGLRADELLLHRLAGPTLRAFLDGVCANLGGHVVQA